jgi:hypothetical protein
MRAAQIIGWLLPESHTRRRDEFDVDTATALMRDHDGRISLAPLTREQTREMPFEEQIMTTGCFRRGNPIIDPVTREVMGYEMEMISEAELRMSGARMELSY